MGSMVKRMVFAMLVVGAFVAWNAHTDHDVVVAQRRAPMVVTRIFTGPSVGAYAMLVVSAIGVVFILLAQWKRSPTLYLPFLVINGITIVLSLIFLVVAVISLAVLAEVPTILVTTTTAKPMDVDAVTTTTGAPTTTTLDPNAQIAVVKLALVFAIVFCVVYTAVHAWLQWLVHRARQYMLYEE